MRLLAAFAVAVVTCGCASGADSASSTRPTPVADSDGVLARQENPYVVIDGVATTLGGGSGTVGQFTGVLHVVVGHRLTVVSGTIRYPAPTSSDSTVLAKQGDDYDGVFLASRPGRAQLLIDTPACVRPAEATSVCVLADVEVTG